MKNIDDEDRAFRGSSWFDSSADCRASCRFRNVPSRRDYDLGFRVVHRKGKT